MIVWIHISHTVAHFMCFLFTVVRSFLSTLKLFFQNTRSFWLRILTVGFVRVSFSAALTDDLLKSLYNCLPVARATLARFCFLCAHMTGCWRHRGRDAARVWSTLDCIGLRGILRTCWIESFSLSLGGLPASSSSLGINSQVMNYWRQWIAGEK